MFICFQLKFLFVTTYDFERERAGRLLEQLARSFEGIFHFKGPNFPISIFRFAEIESSKFCFQKVFKIIHFRFISNFGFYKI